MPVLVVTNAGLAVAASASPTGPYIDIVQFQLGADYSTPALATQTGLIGTSVYTGTPSSFSFYDSTTVQVNCEIPASAGPFTYGEFALFMPSSVMFARFSYGVQQFKVASSGSGYSNTIMLKALIRLTQGPSVFQFNTSAAQTILEVSGLSVVNTPSSNPDNPVIIAHETNDYQQSVLLYKNSSTLWNIADYSQIGTAAVTAAPDTSHITASFFATMYMNPSTDLGKYIIQTAGGYLRSLTSISSSTVALAETYVTSGLVGQNVAVYQLNATMYADLAASMVAAIGSIGYATGSAPGIIQLDNAPNLGGTAGSPAGSITEALTAGKLYAASYSNTSAGYAKLLGGLILQWGQYTFTDPPSGPPGYVGAVGFSTSPNIVFPNTCYQVQLSFQQGSGGYFSVYNNYQAMVTALSTSGFSFQIEEWGSAVNPGVLSWFAIGN